MQKHQNLSHYIFSLICLALVGCASGPAFQKVPTIPRDKGLIYIYRPSTMNGAALVPYVVVDDSNAIALKTGGYYPYLSKPGDVTVYINHTGQRSVKFHVEAGKTYYVKGGTIFMGFGIPFIEQVPEQTALVEIADCKLLSDTSENGALPPLPPSTPTIPSAGVTITSDEVPFLAESRRPKFQEYMGDASPKAFAISKNGHYGKASGIRPKDQTMPSDPKERALKLCNAVAGEACFLYAVDNNVVYQTISTQERTESQSRQPSK